MSSVQDAPIEAIQSRPLPQNLSFRKSSRYLKRMFSRWSNSEIISMDSSSSSRDFSLSSMELPPTCAEPVSHHRPRIRFFRQRRRACDPSSSHLMEWLQSDCPQDLIPKILAFTGPKIVTKLSRTNRFWNTIIAREQTWQTLSEELYKWKEGDEKPPCWKDYYRYNPCVPVDFPSITRALASATAHKHLQNQSIRILLRPGSYILREPITVEANHGVDVTVETMCLPDSFHRFIEYPKSEKPKKRKKSLKQMLSCSSVDTDDEEDSLSEIPEPSSVSSTTRGQTRAVLTLRSRKHNQPVVKVRRGSCILRNLELRHTSDGLDIWNGNSVVQIQPPSRDGAMPISVASMPTALLDHVDITSESGRGVVNIDGGNLTLRHCYIHDCAATGVYMGAALSKLTMEHSDVVRNGNGNSNHRRRGVARGHSGIYLEQGLAEITDSNISHNCSTGISAVNPANSILHLSTSELVSNGTTQLEMPAIGTTAYRKSSTREVHSSNIGNPKPRSALLAMENLELSLN